MQGFFLSLTERSSMSRKPSGNGHLPPCWGSPDCTGNKTGTGKSDCVTKLMPQQEIQKQRNHNTILTSEKAKQARSGQGQRPRFSSSAWLSVPGFWRPHQRHEEGACKLREFTLHVLILGAWKWGHCSMTESPGGKVLPSTTIKPFCCFWHAEISNSWPIIALTVMPGLCSKE